MKSPPRRDTASDRRSAVAVGLVIVPAVAVPAALALSSTALFAPGPPAGLLSTQALALALAALFLAPLPRPAASRFAIALETISVAFLAAGALAAAAVFSGSPAPGAETAAATAVAANAFLLGRIASRRGDGAAARHVVLAFVAVFAAPFAGYCLADFGAPGAVHAAAVLRELNPLRALPPWDGDAPSWLALALPAALALSLVLPSRPPRAVAAAATALALAIAAAATGVSAASAAIEVEIVVDAPARRGEWVAVRSRGAAYLAIGGGVRVAPPPDGAPALVPVGPLGASSIVAGASLDEDFGASFPGPGDAEPGDVRVGVVASDGEGLPLAAAPARLARVRAAAIAALGADGLSVLDALVLPRGGELLGPGERAAIERFAGRGGVVAAPDGDPLLFLSRPAGLGRIVAFAEGEAVRAAVAAALELRPSLEPGAVDPDVAPFAAAALAAVEREWTRAYATVAWLAALATFLFLAFLATRVASGLLLAAGAVVLAAGATLAAVSLRGDRSGAIGAAARVVFASAAGGPARGETWLALAPLGRASARFEAGRRGEAAHFREVAPAEMATPGASLDPSGALAVALPRGAVRVFVAEGDGEAPGGVVLSPDGMRLRNAGGAALLDVRLVQDGAVAGGLVELPAGEERALEAIPPGVAGAPLEAAALRFFVARAERGRGAFVVARAPAPAAALDAAGIESAASTFFVLRIE